jgi:hypothetical protein
MVYIRNADRKRMAAEAAAKLAKSRMEVPKHECGDAQRLAGAWWQEWRDGHSPVVLCTQGVGHQKDPK